MDQVKSAVILFCLYCLGLSIYSQSGTIDFKDHIPSGCSNEPILKIGLIADPQYCDCDPGGTRYFRETMWKLPQAIDTMNKYEVDFVMNLGDMIDRYYESYDSVSKHYENLNMPWYNLLGNHEFEEVADELKSTIVSRYGMPDYYYAIDYKDWHFLVLDGTELASYSGYIHPDLAEEGDSVWNSVQGMINGLSWNGGISKAQQSWIRSEIEQAADSGQNVILFCHFPVYPDSVDLNLWNKDEIITLLEQYPNVAAYINGHLHEGNYGYKNNIHYCTQAAMLDTPDTNSFAILRIYPKEIVVEGFGRVPDRIMPYTSFTKKALQIFLSDTILYYSHLKNDLTGYLSFVSPDTSMLVNYVIDTTLYVNRYFKVSHDSLILNTDEDLSFIPDLKINIIAVDCDADTFSQTFDLLFDTTVMKFRYPLSDTILSVYEDFTISVDALIQDYSKSGMEISLSAKTTGIVSYIVTDDSVKLIPERTGNTEIILAAHDPFTGRTYQQSFSLDVYDPLNHAPYHSDTLMTDYILQPGDTTIILLPDIFTDPDGDSISFSFVLSDPACLNVVLVNDSLRMLGIAPGTANITVTAEDNYDGTDSVRLTVFVNAGPVRLQKYLVPVYQFTHECILIDLGAIFADPNDDVIQYQIFSTLDSILLESSDQLMICPENAGVHKIYLSLSDGKGGFFEDSLEVRFNAAPEALQELFLYSYKATQKQVTVDLGNIFTNADDDTLSYTITHGLKDTLIYSILGDIMILFPLIADTFDFFIIASDRYGGEDSSMIRLVYHPEPTALVSNRLIHDMKIFPNPSSGLINIQFRTVTDVSFGICLADQAGRIIHQSVNLKAIRGYNHYEIKTEGIISKGFYYMILYTDDKQLLSKGILIE
ncbi:MAG: metallophosphoesterase [Bacteroidales bacterium]|nr:metallophosphoesterase [Bacteroidales bacterium]